jgi:hypothetical protein
MPRRINGYGILRSGMLVAHSIRLDKLSCITGCKDAMLFKGDFDELAAELGLKLVRVQVLILGPANARHGRTGSKRVVSPDGSIRWKMKGRE